MKSRSPKETCFQNVADLSNVILLCQDTYLAKTIMQHIRNPQKDSLSKALGLFIEAMRLYIIATLEKQAGNRWEEWFIELLSTKQKELWKERKDTGTPPEVLIDYGHLSAFAIKYKELLKADLGKFSNSLPTHFDTISQTRNKIAHYTEITQEEYSDAFIQMKKIANALKMEDLAKDLEKLKNIAAESPQVSQVYAPPQLKPWFQNISPHADIKQGNLDESVFAANLAEVAQSTGREVYNNAVTFFSKTYITQGLKSIVKTVVKGLNGSEDAENRVISLQTGFGGGKTHTLISLYHIGKGGSRAQGSAVLNQLFQETEFPNFESAKIAVFTNTTNDAIQGRIVEGIHIKTIWGEIAYQLGGLEAYNLIKANDEQMVAPAGLFKQVLAQCQPALILIDELADYCVKAAGVTVGQTSLADQTISFMQEFTQAISETNHCVAVVTLPASPQEVGNTQQAQDILSSLEKRVSRIGTDTQPVVDEEIYEVIRRRLFEELPSPEAIEVVVSAYMAFYQDLNMSAELPTYASQMAFKQQMIKSYPFHPSLIDIFRVKWGSNPNFQRTRGVLRLLAAIVNDLWKRQNSLTGDHFLIHSGHVRCENLDALTGQMKRLFGNGYDAVLSADVSGSISNAFKIDGIKPELGQLNLTQSLATAILLNSFGNEGINKGLSIKDLKLQLLSPNSFSHNFINSALDELENKAFYLYNTTGQDGKRYWFHTKPNINILINQAKAEITQDAINTHILTLLNDGINARNSAIKILIDPVEDLPEQMSLTLVLLSPQYASKPDALSNKAKDLITKIATKKGNNERIYRNTIVFLIPSEITLGQLNVHIRAYLAAQKIQNEYPQLEADQKADLKKRMEEAQRKMASDLAATYSIVAKYSAQKGISTLNITLPKENLSNHLNVALIDLLKEEEWLIENVGINTLRSHNLVPTIENALSIKMVYEAFLRYDDKPMLVGKYGLEESLKRYCMNGEFGIATGTSNAYTRVYYQEPVPYFTVEDESYWLVDKSLSQVSDVELPPPVIPINPNPLNPVLPISPTPPEADTKPLPLFKNISIKGNVPVEHFTQLFTSFINPLLQNNIEIHIEISAKSTENNPLGNSSQVFQSVKESAKQIGLTLDTEE